MEYILTQNEYDDLVHCSELDKAEAALGAARDKLLELAGYTCIHERTSNHLNYCTGCPCDPLEHSRNGNGASFHVWKKICGRNTAYGK